MASDKSKRNASTEIKVPNIQLPISKPSLSVDVDYYQSIIDDPEVSDERKRELIEIVGAIVMNFIDIGFGVHPVQLARQEQQPHKYHNPKRRNSQKGAMHDRCNKFKPNQGCALCKGQFATTSK